jgi:PhnB protein
MTDTANPVPDPSVMKGVLPYIDMRGKAAEAADFYIKAFGAKDLGRMPGQTPGRLMHCQIEINCGAFMMTDHREGAPEGGFGHLQLVVLNGQEWWNRAIAAGCAEVMPYERRPWGDDWGLLRDPYGLNWAILQPGPQAMAKAVGQTA